MNTVHDASARDDFFASDSWAGVLRDGFGASMYRAPDGMPWTFFRRAGLCVGYLRFPVGVWLPDAVPAPVPAPQCPPICDLLRTDARVVHPACRSTVGLVRTVVDDLGGWSDARLAKDVKRKLRHGRGLDLRAARPTDADTLFAIHAGTIRRHGGALRYGRAYFAALVHAASRDARLRVEVAEAAGRIAGYMVSAHDRETAYYLHGGYAEDAARLRPGYILMHRCIGDAAQRGCRRFDLLASPAGQAPLVAYKESFGGTSHVQSHYETPLTWPGRLLAAFGRARRRSSS